MCSTTCSARLSVKKQSTQWEKRSRQILHKQATLTISVLLKIKKKEKKKEKRAQKSFFSPISSVCWVFDRLSLDSSQQAALYVVLQALCHRKATSDKYCAALYEGTVADLSWPAKKCKTISILLECWFLNDSIRKGGKTQSQEKVFSL